MSLSKLDSEKLTIEDVQTSSSSCRREINTTTYDDYILSIQTSEKQNQEHFVLTFPKTPMPDKKKRSGPSELEVAVPIQVKRKIEKDQKPTHVWINQFLRDIFLKSSFSRPFITQAPFKYLYNPQNHYTMAESRKSKNDERRKTLKIKFRGKISSCVVNLEPMRTITNGEPEILGNTEKNPSKSSHKIKLPKTSNSTSETNLEYNNSKKTLEMSLRNGNKNSMNFVLKGNAATCCKDNPNTDSKKSVEEFSDDISECINSSNMDLMLRLNEFRAEFTDLDVWSTNCSQNNAKKPLKTGGKKERDSDIDSGGSKDAKKEGKKKGKRESRKKRNTESSDAESGDSKDGKKKSKHDKKNEIKKKKDTDSTGSGSGASMVSKKGKTEKKSTGKKSTGSTGSESVDSKSTNKVKKQVKKGVMKKAVSTDSESDASSKKSKKDEKKENKGRKKKPIKDTESTDADSESEGDSTGKKNEKKDKKITKKGEKKDAKKNTASSESESDLGVNKKKTKIKEIVSFSDSTSDSYSKAGRRKNVRRSDSESEDSSGFRVLKSTDDSEASSTDSKTGMPGMRRGFRSLSKKTTFNERGKRSVTGRIPSSRERLPFPPCEPFRASPKPVHVCKCKESPSPKARYAPLPGVEWIHKLL
ncbi:cylicin-1 [Mus musculus]|uniref:Cylicin-1 n=1 Tax=Mus musculus TaxID=10090 RepID=CYLC1_MOUSE|nr:cylicin-1 [Mus musculus]|eukprot:XP_006528327.1 PREDICTED: cylicin-1 isoform X1 [Mus musculus]